jgi:glycine dehydrogenase subunit 1
LWAITAAVYLSLLGPRGLRELAEVILKKSHYAAKILSEVDGVKAPILQAPFYQEFTVNFGKKKVSDVTAALLSAGIQGGKDITTEFPRHGNTALFCVTEVHSEEDIEKLVGTIRAVLS